MDGYNTTGSIVKERLKFFYKIRTTPHSLATKFEDHAVKDSISSLSILTAIFQVNLG